MKSNHSKKRKYKKIFLRNDVVYTISISLILSTVFFFLISLHKVIDRNDTKEYSVTVSNVMYDRIYRRRKFVTFDTEQGSCYLELFDSHRKYVDKLQESSNKGKRITIVVSDEKFFTESFNSLKDSHHVVEIYDEENMICPLSYYNNQKYFIRTVLGIIGGLFSSIAFSFIAYELYKNILKSKLKKFHKSKSTKKTGDGSLS